MKQVLDYLTANRSDFDREYERVARQATEREKYWRKHEQQRRIHRKVTRHNFPPERAAAWARLNALKQQGKAT